MRAHDLFRLLRGIAAALALSMSWSAADPANAQDRTIVTGEPPAKGTRGFGGRAVDRVSPTTVIHLQLEPAAEGGGELAFALLIKGPKGWNEKQVKGGAVHADSGFAAEHWTIGDSLQYTIDYNDKGRVLRVFGETIDLAQTSLLLVTLNSAGTGPKRVERAGRPAFRLAKPRGGVRAFMKAVPAAVTFASTAP